MVRNLITGDEPIGDEGVVGVVERSVVGHPRRAAVRVLALCQELVDGVEGIGLDGIIGSENKEHRRIGL